MLPALQLAVDFTQGSGSGLPPHHSVTSTSYTSPNNTLSEVSSNPNLAAVTTTTAAVQLKLKRSNSWSYDESFEDYKFDDERTAKEKESEKERKLHETQCRMLDPTAYQQYDEYLRAYANILYHWGLRNQSKHVMNYVTVSPEPHRGVEFSVSCHYCRKDVRGAQCGSCKYPAFNCSICHLGVKGASNFCLTCGHGGHASHMLEWFKEQNTCPTGCGCKCLQGKTYITNSID